jgi:predicted amidohydrolase
LTERSEDKIYNTAIFISPEGNILLKYRKINVLTVAQDIYSIGETLSVVKTPFGVVGVNICSDNYIDSLDIGHTLARMGAQIILSPSSWTVDYSIVEGDILYGKKWLKPYQTLAVAHDLIVVSATAVGVIVGGVYEGKKMVGCSLAVNKDGIIAEGKYNEFTGQLVIADITIPPPRVLGTAIGESLKMRGLYH